MSRVVYLVGFDELYGDTVAEQICGTFTDVRFKWWPIVRRNSPEPFPDLFEFETDRLTSVTWPHFLPRPDPADVENQLLLADQDFVIALMMFDRWKIREEMTSGSLSSDTIISHTARVLAYWTAKIKDDRPLAALFSGVPHNYANYLFLVALRREGVSLIVGRTAQIGPSYAYVDGTLKADFTHASPIEGAEVRYDLVEDVASRIRSEPPAYMKNVTSPSVTSRMRQKFSQKPHDVCSTSLWSRHLAADLLSLFKRKLTAHHSSRMMADLVRRDRAHVEDCIATGRFIYLPLHLQPEATTSPLAGTLNDQRLFVEAVAAAAKTKGLKVLVKENPKQVFHFRDESFWRDIKTFDNVLAVDRFLNTFRLIRGASVVATLNGTAGWEAACNKIPVIAHDSAVYKGAPSVFVFSSLAGVQTALDHALGDGGNSEPADVATFLRGLTLGSIRGQGLNTGWARDEVSSRYGDEVNEIANQFSYRLTVILNQPEFRGR